MNTCTQRFDYLLENQFFYVRNNIFNTDHNKNLRNKSVISFNFQECGMKILIMLFIKRN